MKGEKMGRDEEKKKKRRSKLEFLWWEGNTAGDRSYLCSSVLAHQINPLPSLLSVPHSKYFSSCPTLPIAMISFNLRSSF